MLCAEFEEGAKSLSREERVAEASDAMERLIQLLGLEDSEGTDWSESDSVHGQP
jgi:hypothetical protein